MGVYAVETMEGVMVAQDLWQLVHRLHGLCSYERRVGQMREGGSRASFGAVNTQRRTPREPVFSFVYPLHTWDQAIARKFRLHVADCRRSAGK